MSCISEGDLRARREGMLPAERAAEIDAHLVGCAACRARADAIGERAAWVEGRFAAGEPAVPPPPSWAHWRARMAAGEDRPHGWPRWAWVGAVVIAVVLAGAFWPAARSRAADILGLLRVERVAVAPVSLPLAGEPEVRRQVGQMLEQMISQDLVVTLKPGPPRAAASPAAASALAGFSVRLPAGATPARLAVSGEMAFQMAVDRARAQAILDEAGRPDLRLPAAVDGELIAVHIPRGAVAEYGSCPPPGAGRTLRMATAACLVLHEVPSPTLRVPPNLDLEALAKIGLQFAGMSADEAAAFCQTVDWRSTLVIPVPRERSSYRRLPVDGVSGILVRQDTARAGVAPRFALIWVRQGVVYSFTGRGDPALATSLANQIE